MCSNIYNWNDDNNLCFQIHLQKPVIQMVQHKLGLCTLNFLKIVIIFQICYVAKVCNNW